MPSLTFSGGLQVATPQVSDIPQSSPILIPIAWKYSSTSTGVGAAPTFTATASSRPSCLRSAENICSSALATAAASSSGTSSPACSRRTFWIAASTAFWAGSRCSSGSFAAIASSPAFSFSQIRGHREEPGRVHLRQELDDLARVGADRHREPVTHGQVVVGPALGDVRRRQPRDHLAVALGKLDQVLDAGDQAHQVAVGELHALGRAGGARGVDQGQQVVRAHLARPTRTRRSRRPSTRARRRSWCRPRRR